VALRRWVPMPGRPSAFFSEARNTDEAVQVLIEASPEGQRLVAEAYARFEPADGYTEADGVTTSADVFFERSSHPSLRQSDSTTRR